MYIFIVYQTRNKNGEKMVKLSSVTKQYVMY